jgi:S1-C subfamily serine protease/HSP20 family molecular chaperone IbpA
MKTVLVFCLIFLLLGDFAWSDSLRQTPIVKVVRQNADSVVNISTERIVYLRESPFWGTYGNKFDFFFDQFFDNYIAHQAVKLKSVGSGVVLDREGLIITNAHVVNMASNIYVLLKDGTSVRGKVMYEDRQNDLAVIKIDPPKPLTAVRLGNADDIMIGETVIAIGNPLGLENTVTSGIISGKHRRLSSFRGGPIFDDLLQLDAPINPGNSGGALLNLDGDLIGINVAVVQDAQNIGFAIPVDKVKDIMEAYNRNKDLAVKQNWKKSIPRHEGWLPGSRYDFGEEWDPFAEIERMHEEMTRMFKDSFGKYGSSEKGMFDSSISYNPNFNIEHTDKEYIVKLDITGLDKDKIDIEINKDSITISGQRSEQTEKTAPNSFYKAKSYGFFSKTIPLPEDVVAQDVKTEIKEDTLFIRLPKKQF